MTRKWESIAQIKKRTGLKHDEIVDIIREGMMDRNCRCIPFTEDSITMPIFSFDEDNALFDADLDNKHAKSGLWG